MFYNNITLLTDLYELTMMQGYLDASMENVSVVFDLFYRANPLGNGYSITAGLAQVIDYIKNLKFNPCHIDYLKSLQLFNDNFLNFLENFTFTGDIYAIEEGNIVFPQEPLLRVSAPIMEAQLIEAALLNIINHQSLIATKAARVCWAAAGDSVMEFGLRRAQGPDAGIYGARAAVIGGCVGTSNVLAGKLFDIPVKGTHAHSWIMSFVDEITAFREYAKTYPQSLTLLVDTYDTLRSGIPNAIKVFNELKDSGRLLENYGIRLDSGDLAYLSKKARIMLDEAGFSDAVISASSDLDEELIADLKAQGAKITVWGVGTNLITSKGSPAFGGVYKLVAKSIKDGEYIPKIKLSENPAKITTPGVKKIYRLYDTFTNKIKADLITLADETVDNQKALTIFDPNATWKRMTLAPNKFYAKELLVPIFVKGKCIYQPPSVMEIREHCKKNLDTLWDEHKRLSNPHIVPVDLSLKLYELKKTMIDSMVTNE